MAHILAVTWDGGGNVPPLPGIAARLRERGHRVPVLGHPGQRDAVEATGPEFAPYRHARPGRPGPGLTGRAGPGTCSRSSPTRAAEDVAAELTGPASPDLVLADCMLLARAPGRRPVAASRP